MEIKLDHVHQYRWLKTVQIVEILTQVCQKQISLSNISEINQPESGNLYLIDKTVMKRWRKDKHDWKKRPDGRTVRENQEKLRLNGKEVLVAAYTHGTGENGTPESLHRRAHWLISDPKYVLIHYLDESKFQPLSVSSKNTSSTSESTLQDIQSLTTHSGVGSDVSSLFSYTEAFSPQEESNHVQENNDLPSCGEVKPNLSLSFEEMNMSDADNTGRDQQNDLFLNRLSHSSMNELSTEPLEDVEALASEPTGEIILSRRIFELERRLRDLESQNREHGGINQSHRGQLFQVQTGIKIVDFSPEWDQIEGGAKVLVCTKENIQEIFANFKEELLICQFGEKKVQAQVVQPGVIRCYAPPNEPGYVDLAILYNGRKISKASHLNYNNSKFEYRRQCGVKRRGQFVTDRQDLFSQSDREFKIRLIDRLSFMDQKLNNIDGETDGDRHRDNDQGTGDKSLQHLRDQLRTLTDGQLDEKTSEIITRIVAKLFGVAAKNSMIDIAVEHDEFGYSLVHYIAATGLYKVMPVFDEYGIDLDTKSAHGYSPLMIAVARGQEITVLTLLNYGASMNTKTTSPRNRRQATKVSNLTTLGREGKNVAETILREASLNELMKGVRLDDPECDGFDENKDILWTCEGMQDGEDGSELRESDEDEDDDDLSLRLKDEAKIKLLEEKFESRINKQTIPLLLGATDDESADKNVEKIQKNVRGWLIRRQYYDIKHAATFLQKQIRSKLARERYVAKKNAVTLLQRHIRQWLNTKGDTQ